MEKTKSRPNKRETGSHYEERVAAFLQSQGMEVLEKNFRCRSGEIDLIARDGRYLVFIEVKYRSSQTAGSALEAIGPKKAAKIRRVAQVYLMKNHYPEDTPCRFDAAGIDGAELAYIRNAF